MYGSANAAASQASGAAPPLLANSMPDRVAVPRRAYSKRPISPKASSWLAGARRARPASPNPFIRSRSGTPSRRIYSKPALIFALYRRSEISPAHSETYPCDQPRSGESYLLNGSIFPATRWSEFWFTPPLSEMSTGMDVVLIVFHCAGPYGMLKGVHSVRFLHAFPPGLPFPNRRACQHHSTARPVISSLR
jgi:hypothetical protein